MTNNQLGHDLIISGSGSAAGGTYRNIKINGDGTVSGDTGCIVFKTNGSSRAKGNVKSELMKVNGMAYIEGRLDAGEVNINGQTDIGGDANVRTLKLHGKTEIGGSLTGERLDIGGEVNVHMDCEAEWFIMKGGFNIGGLLNAGKIEIHLYGPCKVKEIGGGQISVKQTGLIPSLQKIIQSLFPGFEKRLTADTIEGDDIYLEYTTAKVVRGGRIYIGPGCEIEHVEYKEHFEQVKGSTVNEFRQT